MYRLVIASLSYLSLPSFLFFVVWIDKAISVISVLILLFLIIYAVGQVKKIAFSEIENVDRKLVVSSFLFSLGLCLISEFGLSPYKSHDYLLHNYKYYLLASQELPLYDEKYGINLCYYLGFYIVPAIAGKLFGLHSVQYLSFLWIWTGAGLSFIWMQIMLRRSGVHSSVLTKGIWVLLLLVGSYVNIILPLYDFLIDDPFVLNNSVFINNNFVLNQVPVFTRSFSESTQHTLPAILGIAILINLLKYRGAIYASIIVLFSTLFWSPFSTIGLFCFVLAVLIREVFSGRNFQFLLTVTGYGITALIAFSPIIVFLMSSRSTDMGSNKFIWESGSSAWLFYYLLYLFSFWGIWLLLIGKYLFRVDREMMWISTGIFAFLGLLQMGYYNDLNIRATIPAQVILSLIIVVCLVKQRRNINRKLYILVLLFFFVNSLSVWKFYYERFFVLGKVGAYINTIEHPMNDVFGDNFYDNLKYAYPKNGDEVIKQYSLREGSFFEKYMLKK